MRYKDNVVKVYGVQTWEGSWSAWLYMDFDLKPWKATTTSSECKMSFLRGVGTGEKGEMGKRLKFTDYKRGIEDDKE